MGLGYGRLLFARAAPSLSKKKNFLVRNTFSRRRGVQQRAVRNAKTRTTRTTSTIRSHLIASLFSAGGCILCAGRMQLSDLFLLLVPFTMVSSVHRQEQTGGGQQQTLTHGQPLTRPKRSPQWQTFVSFQSALFCASRESVWHLFAWPPSFSSGRQAGNTLPPGALIID